MNNYPFKRQFLLINNGKYPAICYILHGWWVNPPFVLNKHPYFFVGHEFTGKPQQ